MGITSSSNGLLQMFILWWPFSVHQTNYAGQTGTIVALFTTQGLWSTRFHRRHPLPSLVTLSCPGLIILLIFFFFFLSPICKRRDFHYFSLTGSTYWIDITTPLATHLEPFSLLCSCPHLLQNAVTESPDFCTFQARFNLYSAFFLLKCITNSINKCNTVLMRS